MCFVLVLACCGLLEPVVVAWASNAWYHTNMGYLLAYNTLMGQPYLTYTSVGSKPGMCLCAGASY